MRPCLVEQYMDTYIAGVCIAIVNNHCPLDAAKCARLAGHLALDVVLCCREELRPLPGQEAATSMAGTGAETEAMEIDDALREQCTCDSYGYHAFNCPAFGLTA